MRIDLRVCSYFFPMVLFMRKCFLKCNRMANYHRNIDSYIVLIGRYVDSMDTLNKIFFLI